MKGKARVKVGGVRLASLRAYVAAGDMLLSPGAAARIVRACQSPGAAPAVTRQVVALWAQRYGVRGVAYVYEPIWRAERMQVSLVWLADFLERSGRCLEAPAA